MPYDESTGKYLKPSEIMSTAKGKSRFIKS